MSVKGRLRQHFCRATCIRSLAARSGLGITASALILATTVGCSGSSTEGAPSADEPSTSPSSSSPSAAPFPQVQAQRAAETSLLQLGDFPAGWSTSESEETGDDVMKFRQKLASCLKVPSDTFSDDAPDSAHANTPDFNSPDESQTVSETVVIRTTERVSDLMSALEASSATECYGTTLNDYMQGVLEESDDPDLQQASLGTIEVGRVSFPNYGDKTVVFRATIPFSVSGFDASVYGDLVFVQHANGVALLTFFDQSSPFDVRAMKKYAKLATQRLAAADPPAA